MRASVAGSGGASAQWKGRSIFPQRQACPTSVDSGGAIGCGSVLPSPPGPHIKPSGAMLIIRARDANAGTPGALVSRHSPGASITEKLSPGASVLSVRLTVTVLLAG